MTRAQECEKASSTVHPTRRGWGGIQVSRSWWGQAIKQWNFDGRVKPCNGEYLANTLAKSVWDSCQIRVKVHRGWHVSDVIIKYE